MKSPCQRRSPGLKWHMLPRRRDARITCVSDENRPRIGTVGCAFPRNYLPQSEIIQLLSKHLCENWEEGDVARRRLFNLLRTAQVEGRYLALSVPEYLELTSFAKANDTWVKVGIELAQSAARSALSNCNISPRKIDHVFFVTTTGIATPSLDARLVNRLGLRPDVKRTPIFGLGCAAGAAAVARAADYLKAYPEEIALVVSVEVCSLTLQRSDASMANLIAATLFGDGAASVVIFGAARREHQGAAIVGSGSAFFHDTERAMGWDIVDSGFKVILSSEIPYLVRDRLRPEVDFFLTRFGLTRRSIRHWIVHPGGPRILEAVCDALEVNASAVERSWRVLRKVGNISSASVLLVLGDLLQSGEAATGDYGVMVAMGPGFCAELLLLKW